MKTLFTFVLFALTLATQMTQAADTNIMGTWNLKSPIDTKNGPIYLEIELSKAHLNLTVTCEFQEKSGEQIEPKYLSTSLTTAIETTHTEIKILDEHTANTEDGLRACRAFLTPTTWIYTLSEDGTRLAIDAIVPYMQRLIFSKK